MQQFEIEFGNGRRLPLAADTDLEIIAAIRRAGLWKAGVLYPYFRIYENGEETGGGGGIQSGVMRAPRSVSTRAVTVDAA
jgi:hypothetical protein